MNTSVSNLRTLVVNADMQPLSWAPLSIWSWEDAFVAVVQERVIQVKAYEDVFVHSASRAYQVPSVVALKTYRKRTRVAFTRYHLFLRDQFRCQYCGGNFPTRELTFDHVVPKSKGGRSEWTNIVASCAADNLKKGDRSVAQAGLKLIREPFEPSPYQLDKAARQMPFVQGELHETWMDFLYWDSELEQE